MAAYTYTEHGFKIHSGGIKQVRMQTKCVTQYEDPNAGDQRHVTVLDQYILKMLKDAKERGLSPLSTVPKDPAAPGFPFSQWRGIG